MNKPWKLFRLPAVFLHRQLSRKKKTEADRKLEEEVIALHLGDKRSAYEYRIEKIEQVLFAGTILLLLTVAALIYACLQDRSIPENRLKRDDYGGLTKSRELVADLEEQSEEQIFPVTYRARRYTGAQALSLLAEGQAELEAGIKGENASLDHVENGLFFPEKLANGRVDVSYLTVPYGIVSEQGKITGEPEQGGTLVEIRATLSCQGEELLYETAVMVYPKTLTGSELIRSQVQKALEQADEEQAESEYLELPEEVEGRRIRWHEPSSDLWKIMLFWCLVIPPVIWIGRDAAIRQKATLRREQMVMDYPDILWRMTMLLGAGMTARHAFASIAAGYEKSRKITGERRYAYEEMRYALREMDAGTGEAAAYERFGQRCGLPGYIKMGSLLAVNLRKGTADLRQSLEKEAGLALEERKNNALKAGERAGTKMLFPMILMLGVVIVILVVPAFMAMA